MVPDLLTPSVEQHCIIKFLVKGKMKPAEILHRLNAQYGKETQTFKCLAGTVSFLKAKKIQDSHQLARSW
jgi:hypothetical protein